MAYYIYAANVPQEDFDARRLVLSADDRSADGLLRGLQLFPDLETAQICARRSGKEERFVAVHLDEDLARATSFPAKQLLDRGRSAALVDFYAKSGVSSLGSEKPSVARAISLLSRPVSPLSPWELLAAFHLNQIVEGSEEGASRTSFLLNPTILRGVESPFFRPGVQAPREPLWPVEMADMPETEEALAHRYLFESTNLSFAGSACVHRFFDPLGGPGVHGKRAKNDEATCDEYIHLVLAASIGAPAPPSALIHWRGGPFVLTQTGLFEEKKSDEAQNKKTRAAITWDVHNEVRRYCLTLQYAILLHCGDFAMNYQEERGHRPFWSDWGCAMRRDIDGNLQIFPSDMFNSGNPKNDKRMMCNVRMKALLVTIEDKLAVLKTVRRRLPTAKQTLRCASQIVGRHGRRWARVRQDLYSPKTLYRDYYEPLVARRDAYEAHLSFYQSVRKNLFTRFAPPGSPL